MNTDETMMMDPLEKEPGSGDLVQGYLLGQLLGRGAHGSVFMGVKPGAPETYAIKLIDTQGHPRSFVDRIVRECAITTKLIHPGIVGVHEAGYWGASIFIVMDVASGRSCDQYNDGVLGWELSVEIIRRVAHALNYAYASAHVIHRDIKPANIVVDIVGGVLRSVKVVDFGLSRTVDDEGEALTMTGMVLGTPFYMSPEQARGNRDLTFHTDLYALGATLFYLITGRPPFHQGTPVEILIKHCNEAPPVLRDLAPTCPLEVSNLVARCLAKNPRERFSSYGELIAALDGIFADNPFEGHGAGDLLVQGTRPTQRTARQPGTSTSIANDSRGKTTSIGSDALGDLFREKLQETTKSFRKNPQTATANPPTRPIRRPRPEPASATPEPRAPSLEVGALIDSSYTVLGPIGAGAMGEVYAVQDRLTNRNLALKILSDQDMRRPGAVRRFQGECTALAKVEHPAFPFFAGKGTYRDRDYLLMEHVHGVDLKAWMTKNGKMPEVDALWVAAQLAEAMDQAYAKCGMVHRDIKPANLMFTLGDTKGLKIVDFGVSTYIDYGDFEDFSEREYVYIDDDSKGKAVGTPAYMSPEQCTGQPPSPMMDIYAIGCTFFHLMSGRTPYQAPSTAAMMMKHLQDPLPVFDSALEVSTGTAYLLKRCLAKNPSDRFKNYKQLISAVASAKFSMTARIKRQGTQAIPRPVN